MEFAGEPIALLLLRLQDLARELLHLARVVFKLCEHLVEGAGQPVEALVAVVAQHHTYIGAAAARLIDRLLEPVERIERLAQHPLVDKEADRHADAGKDRDQFIVNVVGIAGHMPDRDHRAADCTKRHNGNVGPEDFIEERRAQEPPPHAFDHVSTIPCTRRGAGKQTTDVTD